MSGLGTISFFDPDDVETILTTQDDLDIIGDIDGHGLPPIILGEERVPGQPGARHRFALHGVREVGIPILVSKTDATTLRARIRSLAARLNPVKGEGRLRWAHGGGDTRELLCRYETGFELRQRSSAFVVAVLVFRATDDPYWRDTADTTGSYDTGDRVPFLSVDASDPFLPFTLVSSSVLASPTIDNTGDVEAWPVWVITGPGTDPGLVNVTTGKRLDLDYALGSGETITIDTRPGAKSVELGDGTNLYQYLTATSAMWALDPGENEVSVEMTGATADSQITLAYRKRYLVV